MTDRVYKTTIRKSFLNSSSLSFEYNNRYVYLTSNFDPTRTPDGTKLPSNNGYSYDDFEFSYRSDQRKRLNFDSKISYGTFYNGTKFTLSSSARTKKS